MKAKSPFFARIQQDVFKIMEAVPHGKLVTFKDVGAHLDVMPRHIAYILANIDALNCQIIPWHRAVAEDGILRTPKNDPLGQNQLTALQGEGIATAPDGRILDFGYHLCDVANLPHCVQAQTRPKDAPSQKSKAKI